MELAVAAQGGFDGGVLGRGRLHPVQGELDLSYCCFLCLYSCFRFGGGVVVLRRLSETEHAVKWYQDKVRKTWLEHKEMEIKEGKIINYATLVEQAAFEDGDALCKLMGPEFEW